MFAIAFAIGMLLSVASLIVFFFYGISGIVDNNCNYLKISFFSIIIFIIISFYAIVCFKGLHYEKIIENTNTTCEVEE